MAVFSRSLVSLDNSQVGGSINNNGDIDQYSVNLIAGFAYQFDALGQGAAADTLVSPSLNLQNSNGGFLSGFNVTIPTLGDRRLTFTPNSTGTYLLRVGGSGTGTYTLSSAPADDYNGSVNTTSLLVSSSYANGILQTVDDEDTFAVNLVAGQTYQFDVLGQGTGAGTVVSPSLVANTGTGGFLGGVSSTIPSLGARRITFTPNATATYLLTVSGASIGSYTLFSPNAQIVLQPNAAFFANALDLKVQLGGGQSNVTLNSQRTVVQGDSGSDYIVDSGGADTVNLGTGTMTINAISGGTKVFGSSVSGSLFFSGGTSAATVFAGAGATTVFGNAGGGQFFSGQGQLLFVGGSGASTVVGGAGQSTLFGGSSSRDLLVAGSGASTVIGGGGGAVVVGRGTAGDALIAGSGAETLIGSADGGRDVLFAGSGPNALFGGTGGNTFVAARGGAQMIAGGGADTFIFNNGAVGSVNSIINFAKGTDHVALFGYGLGAAATALSTATVAFNSTTVTLSDNTRIIFANVTNLTTNDILAG